MANILVRCHDLCTEGLRPSTWGTGWDLPLEKSFMRAITGDERPTANTTTLIDDIFAQVSRARNAGATGHGLLTFLLPLLRPTSAA